MSSLNLPLIHNYLDTQLNFTPYIQLFASLPSTNQYLLDHSQTLNSGTICIAAQQTAGRGRRGRVWQSPACNNIYLSILWEFPPNLALNGLSLVIGIAAAKALNRYGIAGIQLKWPNDIYYNYRKLGGILVEHAANCRLVIGIGINGELPTDADANAWISTQIITGQICEQNYLASLLICELITILNVFMQQGLIGFKADWQALDMLAQQAVTVHTATQIYTGIADGIDICGRLRVRDDQGLQVFDSADVSVRPQHLK